MLHFTPLCITFNLLIKIYCKLYTTIGCNHTDKSIACGVVGCRQNSASIGWIINFCIQSVFSYRNYCKKLNICRQIARQTNFKFLMQTNYCQYWMQHNSLHPKLIIRNGNHFTRRRFGKKVDSKSK